MLGGNRLPTKLSLNEKRLPGEPPFKTGAPGLMDTADTGPFLLRKLFDKLLNACDLDMC
jgi:hypothetical protein